MKIIRIECQLLGHEADLNNRPYTLCTQALVDLVHIGEVVDRISMLILVVDAKLVMQDRVEAEVLHIRDCFYRSQVVLVRRAQNQRRATGPEHLFPEMGEGSCACTRVDRDLFTLLSRRSACRTKHRQQNCDHTEPGAPKRVHSIPANAVRTTLCVNSGVCHDSRLKSKRGCAPAGAHFLRVTSWLEAETRLQCDRSASKSVLVLAEVRLIHVVPNLSRIEVQDIEQVEGVGPELKLRVFSKKSRIR